MKKLAILTFLLLSFISISFAYSTNGFIGRILTVKINETQKLTMNFSKNDKFKFIRCHFYANATFRLSSNSYVYSVPESVGSFGNPDGTVLFINPMWAVAHKEQSITITVSNPGGPPEYLYCYYSPI